MPRVLKPEARKRESARSLAYYYRTKKSRLAIRRGYEAKARKLNPEKFRVKWRNRYAKDSTAKLASCARYRANHRAKVLAAKKKWQSDNWAYRQAYMVKYYAANGEKIKQQRRAAYQVNRVALLEQQRKYTAALPEAEKERRKQASLPRRAAYRRNHLARYAAHATKRRALKMLAAVQPEKIADWMTTLRSGPPLPCYYCRVPIAGSAIHFDHVIPLSKGGPHEIGNLVASCESCNSSKSYRFIGVWNVKTGQQVLSL